MVGIELFGQKVAPWLIVFSIFAVNFRHVLYSAAFGRRIADWPIAAEGARPSSCSAIRNSPRPSASAERGKTVSFAWYFGLGAPIWMSWVAESGLGAYFGRLVANPQALGLDFLLPIYFLGLVMSFRKRPLWLPVVAVSAVASILAYKFVGSPWHVTLGAHGRRRWLP